MTTDKIKIRTRKIRRYILGTICLSSVAFIFQACYGIDNSRDEDVCIKGTVISTANRPISGIKVSVRSNFSNYVYTDREGNFTMYTNFLHEYNLKFEDSDSSRRGGILYEPKDTIVKNDSLLTQLNITLNIHEQDTLSN